MPSRRSEHAAPPPADLESPSPVSWQDEGGLPAREDASWWLAGSRLSPTALAEEQARMRRERLPKGVQEYFDSALRAEEADLLLRRRGGR